MTVGGFIIVCVGCVIGALVANKFFGGKAE